jgi:S-adenosyl methyltransferase
MTARPLVPVMMPTGLDDSAPHIARIYDYWLGGKDNFAIDREAGDQTIEAFPDIVRSVHTNRAFLARSVQFFVTGLGIRQFIDIGTGIPTVNNTHEVAQAAAPECRVVYVDNDPIVLTHAAALLKSTAEGTCDYIDCDMHDTAAILRRAERTLDFTKPVAVTLISILHFVTPPERTKALVDELMAPLPAGSGFAISHPASDLHAAEIAEMIRRLNSMLTAKTTLRSRDEVEQLFAGYDLLPPGVVPAARWRPDCDADARIPSAVWAGLATTR